MTLGDVSDLYSTYPIQSAVVTCGFKASVADGIAQIRSAGDMSKFNLEARRNLAYVLYGGLFIGIMCHMEYDYLFPFLFGSEQSLQTLAEKVIFDNFVSAPLMWLPPAYLIKSLVYDYSLKEGLENYMTDIKENDLLQRYWTMWLPAQSISFSVVPDHLRVAFMASVSFFWFIILSSISSKDDPSPEEAVSSD
jgi:protein Mpv17